MVIMVSSLDHFYFYFYYEKQFKHININVCNVISYLHSLFFFFLTFIHD